MKVTRPHLFSLILTMVFCVGWISAPYSSYAQSEPKSAFDFGTSLRNWQAAQVNLPDAGRLSIEANGNGQSLLLAADQGGWFGINETSAELPMSADRRKDIVVNIATLSDKVSFAIAVQSGSDFTWRQTQLIDVAPNSQKSFVFHLADLVSSGNATDDVPSIRGIWIYAGAQSSFYLDKVQIR